MGQLAGKSRDATRYAWPWSLRKSRHNPGETQNKSRPLDGLFDCRSRDVLKDKIPMTTTTDELDPIVPAVIGSAAREVIESTKRKTPFPYLIEAKLGNAEVGPMMDADTVAQNDTPLYTIAIRWNDIAQDLIETDRQHGNPLCQIARRANDVIARAAILNRHNRRPPLYAETTIREFIKLELSTPEHSPLIRAAGHVAPPPVFPLNHDLTPVMRDIAAHMARSVEPQSAAQLLRSLEDRPGLLDKWPDLDLTLFMRRAADICPDDHGLYHPDQPWGRYISTLQLVANTIFRIFVRDGEPRHTEYLVSEIERLVGQFLPDGYNTLAAVRATISKSDDISWYGPSTFGLREWKTFPEPQKTVAGRTNTGDLIYAYLLQHGTAEIKDVIEHVRQTAGTKRRTVQAAIKNDHENRSIRIPDHRVTTNPIPDGHNRATRSLMVVPDQKECEPMSILRESELVWLTRYVQGLTELTPPLPSRVAITGHRAAGFAHADDTIEIAVVTAPRDRSNLEPRLAKCAAAATEAVPSVQPKIRILSIQQWAQQQAEQSPVAHHNVWLAPDATP